MRRLARLVICLSGAGLLSIVVAPPALAYPPTITLTASAAEGTTNGSRNTVQLVARTDMSPYPYRIVIFDVTANRLLAYCGTTDTSCTASATALTTSGEHVYRAAVGRYTTTYPATDTQSESNVVHVFWWKTDITATPSRQLPGLPAVITAITNKDVGAPTYYFLSIHDVSSGYDVTGCNTGTYCSYTHSELLPDCRLYYAEVTDYSGFYDRSGTIQVCWGL